MLFASWIPTGRFGTPMNVKNSPPGPDEKAVRTSGAWAKTGERVLIVSDSPDMRVLLTDLLSADGFVVFEQPSAIGATRAIREKAIRAVVLDVCAPGVRGEKFVAVMRDNPRLDGLVIVVVTGDGDGCGVVRRGLESANAVLDRASLEFRLTSVLGRLLRSCSFRPQEAFAGRQ